MKFRCNSVPNGAKLFPELKQHYLPDPKAAAAAPAAVGVRIVSLTALTFQPLQASKTDAASKVRSNSLFKLGTNCSGDVCVRKWIYKVVCMKRLLTRMDGWMSIFTFLHISHTAYNQHGV